MIWVTRDGRKLSLSCMECTHMRNSLARIFRMKNWRRRFIGPLLAEINRRCITKTPIPTKSKRKVTQ